MTVKDLRKTTAPYIDIVIVYGYPLKEVTIDTEDPTTLDAFGAFLIDTISIRDEETIAATLTMRPVKE